MPRFFTLFALFLLALSPLSSFAEQLSDEETVYERVMRTQTIRCGYVVLPPHIIKNPNTGELSGLVYEIMERSAKLLGLKIDWAEEVGFGTMNEGLKVRRYDAICFGYWRNPFEAKLGFVNFSTPLYYMPVGAFVRADDTRFDESLEAFNNPSIRISTSDGQISTTIAAEEFPQAQVISLPNLTDVSQNLMEVASGKADVAFLAYRDGFAFEEKNPGKIKNAAYHSPVRVFASTIALLQEGDPRMEVMLNTAFLQLLNGGSIDRLLQKYEEYPGAVLPVAKPYIMPD